MKIKKAVITAAGRGTRFLPVSKAYQKEMVPIMNKPQIQCVIEEAIESGITEIAVVVREGVDTFVNYLEDDNKLWSFLKESGKEDRMASLLDMKENCEIVIIEQKEDDPYGNGTPFIKSADFLNGEDFVGMWGDDIMVRTDDSKPTAVRQLVEYFEKHDPVAVMSVKKVSEDEIVRYGSYEYIPEDEAEVPFQVSNVIEKPKKEEAPSLYANAARFVGSYKVVEELQNKVKGKDGEIWLVDAVMRLIKKGEKVMATPWEGSTWVPVGDPIRWLKGNLVYALNSNEYGDKVREVLEALEALGS